MDGGRVKRFHRSGDWLGGGGAGKSGKRSRNVQERKVCFLLYPSLLKELRHGWRILKKLANFFKFAVRNPC